MFSTRSLMGFIFGLAYVSGCSQNGTDLSEADISAQWLDSKHDNGIELNGVRANGVRANGVRSNGVRSNGVRSNGVRSNGVAVSGVTYNGTSIEARRDDLQLTISGADLNNAEMDGELETGDPLNLKVINVFWSATAGSYLYNVKYFDDDGIGQWLCGTDDVGNPIAAIPLMKAWILQSGDTSSDSSRFTFSCVNASLGKCVLWGYQVFNQAHPETYNSTTKYRDLALLHQTCQRTVRADYCGNGLSHTRNGTTIDVYDSYGVQSPDNADGYSLEADWRPDGAYCIRHTRWGTADSTLTGGQTDLQYIQATCPSRLAANDSSCNNESASTFYKANGFDLANQATRNLLRNQSYQHN